MMKPIPALILVLLSCGLTAQTPADRRWTEVSTPFPAANVVAVGDVFWVCGADEMIASSFDGGTTWNVKHQKRGGEILLDLAFINAEVGHAAGTNGLLLSTTDGGKTWDPHTAPDEVQSFSFADANHGIAVIGGVDDSSPHMDGTVKLTNDGGVRWEDIPALNSDELRPFTQVLSVAALDASHYLMTRRQPNIEDVFLVTGDGGRSWKVIHQRFDATNRELVRQVFVHAGEYWAFGMELVNRQEHGGYGVPLTMHSKDGEAWKHGVNGGLHEFQYCNQQGCRLWDGTIEMLYGESAQYWGMPQDFSLSDKWAIAGNRACTVSTITECGPADITEQPQPRVWLSGGGQYVEKVPGLTSLAFANDCILCGVRAIRLDPGIDWSGRVTATFSVDPGGELFGIALDGLHDNRLRDRIDEMMRGWLLKPAMEGSDSALRRRSIFIDVKCVDVPEAPAVDGCQLTPSVDAP